MPYAQRLRRCERTARSPGAGAKRRSSADGTFVAVRQRPWGGVYRDWRTVSGMRVPFEAEVTWQLASGWFTYAHWLIESMEYDESGCSRASSATSDFRRVASGR